MFKKLSHTGENLSRCQSRGCRIASNKRYMFGTEKQIEFSTGLVINACKGSHAVRATNPKTAQSQPESFQQTINAIKADCEECLTMR